MFDQSLKYSLIQIRKNKFRTHETFIAEYIYKFFRHNERCCIKYIVSVKTYPKGLLTLDYYPKINLTPKLNSLDDIRDLRYRMLTRQNSFGFIGGTVLDIMADVNRRSGNHIWGFLSANLPDETDNANNKRYKVYKDVLSRTFVKQYQVLGNKQNSAIFVIPQIRLADVKEIIEAYEQIFSETN